MCFELFFPFYSHVIRILSLKMCLTVLRMVTYASQGWMLVREVILVVQASWERIAPGCYAPYPDEGNRARGLIHQIVGFSLWVVCVRGSRVGFSLWALWAGGSWPKLKVPTHISEICPVPTRRRVRACGASN